MRRLGLDIGTNSIGWCLIEDGERIVDLGVRIFSDGRDPQSGTSLAVDRREARAARRRRDRYLGRRSAFLEALIAHGLMPADADEAKLIAAMDPYALRARALDEKLHPHEIGRALFHLNQRRGFKSNRKAERKSNDNEDGKIASGARALDQAMAEEGADTLGQFLARRETKRVRMDGENQDYDFYPQRRHVEYEFDRIWKEQARHHSDLLTETARAALHRILFFQRPLKEQEVGLCTFVTRERRLAKAHPLFQERRLYEEVNQLEVTTPGEANRKLTLYERDRLIRELSHKRAIAFTSLATKIKLDPGQSFNKASETRTQLAGDEVRAVLGDKKRFGAAWEHRDRDAQWTIIERLIEEEDPDALHAFLTQDHGLDDEHAAAVAKAPLPEGHGRLGQTATARILDELRKEVITYDEAVRRCGWHHSDHRTGEILPQLPYYGELLTRDIPPGTQDPADPPEKRWGKITNPTVHIGLRQLEKLVNAIIAVHGRPDEIVVELARELKLNEKDKEEHNRRIRRDTAAAVKRAEKLVAEGFPDTGANRMLLRLWEDLNPANPLDRRCPYCGEPIGMRALFSGEADVDHIIPYSRSLDDSAGNKVVAHRNCNRIKGNRTPYEKWGQDADRWDIISAQAGRLHKSKQWRFGPDAIARVEKDGGFLARQLTDTQYLSRLAGKYLGSLYATKDEGSVYVIPGRMTAMLRRLWGLNDILADHNIVENRHSNAPKNRLDHRHHAIDAAVVAVTTRGLLMQIARTAGRAEDRNLDRLFEGLDPPWPGFRDELRERLLAVTVSHKADHGRKGKPRPGHDTTAGRLHNDTAYGLTGETSPKGLPIVVHRVPLASLKPADIADPERIPDPVLREALGEATAGKSGKEFETALDRFRKYHPQFAGIRRVRVREPLSVIPISDAAGRIYKAYKGDSNARFDVWRLPDGKWVSDIVSMFDAHQPDQADRRPHPAARKVLSLRQNDMLAIERDGGPREIVRVVKFSSIGTVALAHDNEAGALKARDAAPNDDDPFKYILKTAGGLKKIKARQIRIDPLGRIFDPGPRWYRPYPPRALPAGGWMERIVDIGTEGLRLSSHRGFLIVANDEGEVGRIALDDVHAVILHAHGCTWTGSLAAALAERGAPIVFCNAHHSPVAVTLPIAGFHAQGGRMRAQWNAGRPLAKQLWQRIVRAKIVMQGALLAFHDAPEAPAFDLIARRVRSGDPDNLEAQAARRYWPALMGPDFRRDRDAAGANALLNYGYAVIRATVARAVVAAGLHPTIGIFHANRGNAFALADDRVEPFRPLVDALVLSLLGQGVETLDPAIKRRFARLIAFDVRIDDELSPVSVAATRLAQSLARSFETETPDLALFAPPTRAAWGTLTRPLDPLSDA